MGHDRHPHQPRAERGRVRRRGADALRQGRPDRRLRRDPRRRPRRTDRARAAAPQPAAAARAHRRGGHRGHDPDRRPGHDRRPQRRAAGRPAEVGARVRDRPDVRRRHDRRHHDRQRHRLRRLRRRGGGRGRAHGPPPARCGLRPQPALRGRAPGRRQRAGHGRDRREPARPLPAADQGAGRRLRGGEPAQVRQGAGRGPDPGRPGRGRRPHRGRPAGASPRSTSSRARRPRVEGLAGLRTPFRPHGRITAGNAAGLNDGATACLLAAEDVALELGLPIRMRLVSYGVRRRRARGDGRGAGARRPSGRSTWPASRSTTSACSSSTRPSPCRC